ncbi:MAG: serine/threonine-protein kinase [Planctomycetota bacterium]|jgi:serine/threonine-protein kinase|nr:serine/threonine-protein kinase [Planctomycetota bacterium]MDP6937933.1 serine/threonine-protein kinase [Planctomycetota bacterium]
MSPQNDARFLALLVHRGYLSREAAEPLLAPLKQGEPLDDLLEARLGWEAERVLMLRRTRAGEQPEIPGIEVLGLLGSGGTADVFRVQERKGGRVIAMKVLNRRCTEDKAQLDSFIREARLLEKLDHPGLVRGYGVNRSGETYLCRQELVEGKTLLEILDEGTAFSEPPALKIILLVAEVLEYMASKDLVHRDVKPGNIMLAAGGEVKLIDLGFCTRSDDRNPEDSAVGTVAYLDPNQAEGGAGADIRSDIYSLGVTLFQLVVGRLPFEGDGDEDTLRMAVMDNLKSPELKSKAFSPHLHFIIEKMMAKDADVRFQSWEEFLSEVRGQLKGFQDLDFTASEPSKSKTRSGIRRRRPPGR